MYTTYLCQIQQHCVTSITLYDWRWWKCVIGIVYVIFKCYHTKIIREANTLISNFVFQSNGYIYDKSGRTSSLLVLSKAQWLSMESRIRKLCISMTILPRQPLNQMTIYFNHQANTLTPPTQTQSLIKILNVNDVLASVLACEWFNHSHREAKTTSHNTLKLSHTHTS